MSERRRGVLPLVMLLGLSILLVLGVILFSIGESDFLLFWGYELAVSLLPWLAVLAVVEWRGGKREQDAPRRQSWVWMLFFVIYLTAVFDVTGSGTLYEALRLGIDLNDGNWIPFSREIDLVGYGLNVILFLPWGFLLPILWPEMDRLPVILRSGFALSLLIEVSQLVNFRASDVDDLLLNTLGALLGWLAFRLASRLFHWTERQTRCPLGAMATTAILFLGRFFLYHEMALARLLYGF